MTIVHLAIVNDTAIVVGDVRVTPAATHLFALLLVLALSTDRPRTRAELQALLFGDDVDSRDASHNLRQLLYRARALGVPMEAKSAGECLDATRVNSAISGIMRLIPEKRALLDREALIVLPGYRPQFTPAFTCWLDTAKDHVEGELRDILLADFRSLRQTHQWRHVAALGATLQILDPWREELVNGRAEALAMLGRKDDAIDAIERFTRSAEEDPEVATSMRRLKARVSRTHIPKRQSTFRGREDCLAYLRAEWEEAQEGGARLVSILGAAGMGKTRVAEEFSTRIRLSRGTVIQHRCDEHLRAYPLALFTRILPELRSLRGSLGASPLYSNALDRMIPTAGASAADIPVGSSAEALRADIQLGLVDLMEAVSAEQELLLLIDDAHHLDEASAAVLRLLTSTNNSAAAMILACSRTREDALSFLGESKRSSSYILAPLAEEHVRALILEQSDSAALTECDLSWGSQQAAGNPYFAQTLGVSVIKDRSTPVSVSALASTAYFGLSSASRTTLEATLILGQHATLPRLELLLQWSVFATLSALRELEARDLVSFSDGLLLCPHSLFCDAIRELIPTTVAASLHRHIARLLEDELSDPSVSPDVALAAARSWLAAGDVEAAVTLTRRCARTAASLGEPAAAVVLLSGFLHAKMPSLSRKWILGDLILYASDTGDRAVLLTALSERLEIAEREEEDSVVTRTLQLQIIQAEIAAGKKLDGVSTELRSLLTAANLPPLVRVEAGVFLMIAADMDLDCELGEEVFVALQPLISELSECDPLRIRAELVYHTSFGDVTRACQLVARVQSVFSSPSIDKFIDSTRHFAAFSLLRIGRYAEALTMCELDFTFMCMKGVWSKAERSAALMAEIFVAQGLMDDGEHWLKEAYSCARRGQPLGAVFSHGCVSSAAAIDIHHRRFAEALKSVTEAKRDLSLLSSRRFLGVLAAQEMRIAQLGGDSVTEEQVLWLKRLYRLGRCAGGQDTIVEALWVADTNKGDGTAAHNLLNQYLSVARRELGVPEWSLCRTTADDTAWLR